jgi:hypothetical protein
VKQVGGSTYCRHSPVDVYAVRGNGDGRRSDPSASPMKRPPAEAGGE